MSPPTLDRIFLGVVAGAITGGIAFEAGWAIYFWQWPKFHFAILIPLALLVVMPFFFVPLWVVARFVGLRGWLGATVAGAAFFSTCAISFDRAMADYFGDPAPIRVGMLTLYALVGAAIGFVTWRVAYWSVGD